ncbi:hypothetical protein ILYODFUR_032895 [Ilyodon furcidens]|uniref:Uncharacterized protein n=1 Tax=Ilyodon furcidens TaxID=33524 RepID=A0ABV0SSU5_9TELE
MRPTYLSSVLFGSVFPYKSADSSESFNVRRTSCYSNMDLIWSQKHRLAKEKVATKTKGHILIFGWTSFSSDYGSIRCGIVSISFCNVTRFISTQCCIHFSPRSCIDDGRVKTFSRTSQRFSMGLRSGLWWPVHV